MDGLRQEVPCAIQCHQKRVGKEPHRVHKPALLHQIKAFLVDWIQQRGIHGVQ